MGFCEDGAVRSTQIAGLCAILGLFFIGAQGDPEVLITKRSYSLGALDRVELTEAEVKQDQDEGTPSSASADMMNRSLVIGCYIFGLSLFVDCRNILNTCILDEESLQNAIQSTADGGTITLCEGSSIDISKAIDLSGRSLSIRCETLNDLTSPSCILDGRGRARFFEGDSVEAYFEGISFHRGRSGPRTTPKRPDVIPGLGGALYFSGLSDITVVSSDFTNCEASIAGGAIVVGAGTTLTLTDCSFRNNVAYFGGALNLGMLSLLDATNCVFERNVALSIGGALSSGGVVKISLTGCDLRENSAGEAAGAVGASGFFDSIESRFESNDAGELGGAIVLSEVSEASLTACTLQDNVVAPRQENDGVHVGGGAMAISNTKRVELKGCQFNGNSAPQGDDVYMVEGNASPTTTDRSDFDETLFICDEGTVFCNGEEGIMFSPEGSTRLRESCNFQARPHGNVCL